MNLIGNINAIPFRRFRGGGGVAPFPSIPGMIARYSALGLTNEQMKENPVWVDKTGNGYDLQLKNFAWGGMSGVGGYEMNFNLWRNNVSSIPDISMSTTTTSVSVSVGNSTYNNNLIYIHISNWDINKNHWLKVTSTYEDGDLTFMFYNGSNTKKIGLPANGYVNILAYPEFKGSYMYISTISNKQGSFTIEQLPLYPGFILGDGVDDFAVTEKELNFEDTYTVYTAFIPFQDDPARNMILCGKNDTKDFSINYSGTHLNFKPSTGVNLAVRIDQFALLVCKRNKDITTIINLSTGESRSLKSVEFISNPGLYYLWRNMFATFHARAAIAGQTICNGYFSTDEDDEKVLDWYKKQYPWLFFDQAWTVTGKSNEDTDRATIKNITGNGNDLVLSNFGFAEGSGYNEQGEYAGYLVTDGVDDKAVSKQFKFGENFTVILDFKFPVKKISYCGFDLSSKVRIRNLQGSGVYVVLKGNKTLIPSNVVRAVTSEGKVYDENWNEYNIVPGNISSNYTMVNLGFDGSNQFAESATKLAGIYSSALSKDDCIKAYNYLQTLKAK